jgi:DNA-binding transcriptional ArsR family regulator
MKKTLDKICEDTGCRSHPSCLDCPEPICLEEIPSRGREAQGNANAEIIKPYVTEGKRCMEIVRITGLSKSTVSRHLKKLEIEG